MELVDEGKRYRFEFDGEAIYVYVSDSAVIPKLPFENRDENRKFRQFIESLCERLTVNLQERNFDELANEIWEEEE